MCCLKYEHPLYAEFARTAPAIGEQVALEDGDGVVVGHQVPADSVVIRMSANGTTRSCSLAAACGARQLYASRTTLGTVTASATQGSNTAAPTR